MFENKKDYLTFSEIFFEPYQKYLPLSITAKSQLQRASRDQERETDRQTDERAK